VDAAGEGTVIKVAAGTYTGINDHGGLAQVVYIDKGVTIQGGHTTDFAGPPDPVANPTTLDAQGGGRVLYIVGELAPGTGISPTIEGLRITGGDAAGLDDTGGGIYVVGASATIRNNQVFSNTAHWGGGLYLQESVAILTGNTIVTNTADDGGGLYLQESDAILSGNTVVSNVAPHDGGGLYLKESDAALAGNAIVGNSASHDGGGLYLWVSDPTLTNNILADNRADARGSGLYVRDSSPILLHTTIVRNAGGDGSGIYVANNSTAALTNTILAGHTTAIATTGNGAAALAATLWGTGDWANTTDWEGTGITSADNHWGNPAFVDPARGDYHIQPASAAIDAGVEAGIVTDIDGQPRPQGDGPDIGADEAPPFPNLAVTHHAIPNPVQAGAQLTLTLRVTNTGSMDLHATITDTLPAHALPGGTLVWTPAITAPGGVWVGRVVVTVEAGYTGPLTSVVEVTSDEGATGTDEHAFVVAEDVISVGVAEGGVLVAAGAGGMTATIQVPPGAVAVPTQLAYTALSDVAGAPSGFTFAGRAFTLDAYQNGEIRHGLFFEVPITVTIHYTEADVSDLDEGSLELRYWNEGVWVADGIAVVERDAVGRRLVARIEHLSEFAMFGQGGYTVYLPLVLRR